MWLSAFVFGIMGSFHCVGMCGPIAFLLPVERDNTVKKVVQIFIYHFGRIVSYSLIGLLFGFVGRSFSIFGLQQKLSIIVGILMIIAMIIPKNRFSTRGISKPIFKLISKIKSALGKELKKKTPDTFLTIGLLNGFLPCGLVYMAVFGAAAMGSAWQGSLYMALFGLGTVPLMTTAIYFGRFLNENIRRYIRKSIPTVVIVMGCLFILRGMGLGIPYISPAPVQQSVSATYACPSLP